VKTTEETRALLGKRVRVTIKRPLPEEAPVICEGKLIGFGTGGDFEILEDDGCVHYCWPLLDIEELP
jgi:hypothetical protein